MRAMTAGNWIESEPLAGGAGALLVEPTLATRGRRLQPVNGEPAPEPRDDFVAESEPMRRLVAEVEQVAPRDVTVLVHGETGSGKELVASLIHARSRRRSGPIVRVNCAAIPAELAEAELFGHVRGAFTGATATRRGYFAEADGGTIVLDEVGELPPSLQPKLLRTLQNGEIQPVGSARVERVDVRVVASTNRDLQSEARAGRFRQDLYYRLAVVELVVPPLREHRDDIPTLATRFARRYEARFGMPAVRLSPALVSRMREAEWPGNVRQLENAVARMVALASDGEVGPDAFVAERARPWVTPELPGDADALPQEGNVGLSLPEQLDAVERQLIIAMLAVTRGNRSEAARRLGIGRTCLLQRMKKYELM